LLGEKLVEILRVLALHSLCTTDEGLPSCQRELLDSLLKDIPKLKRIVTYHVAFGDVRG